MKEINRLKLFTTRKKKVVNLKRKKIEKWNTMTGSNRRNIKENSRKNLQSEKIEKINRRVGSPGALMLAAYVWKPNPPMSGE
jgi:hypothetical protein